MPPTHCSYETHGHDGTEHQPAVADVQTRLEEYQQSSSIIPSKIPASQSQPVPISQPVDPSKMQPLMVQTGTPPGFFTWVPGYFFQQPPFNQQFPNVNAQTFQPSTGNNSPATTASSSPVHFENQEVAKTEISENAASPAQFSQATYPNPIPVPLSAPAGVMMYGPPDVPAFSSSYSSPSQSYPPSQYASPAGYAPDMYQGAAQYGSPAPTTQVGSPPTVQYGSPPQAVTYASPGSYSTPPYGSPAPPMHPAPQAQTSVQPQVPIATTVPALPQIERLNLNNVPMYRPAPAQNLNQPSDMAEVWHREFANKFSKFGHQWELIPVPPQNEDRADGIFEDTAKIRFVCKNCRNGWTSMQGKVKFWYILDQTTQKGKIHFNLFGQKCKKCVSRGVHEIQDALWYPDEIAKVVHNIHCKVGMIYYNMYCPQIQIQRRIGHPKGQHNSELCGACEKGICRRNNPNPFL